MLTDERFLGLPANARLMFCVLSIYANRAGRGYPSYETLAVACGVSRRQAIRNMKLLLKSGLITKIRMRGRNLYQIYQQGGASDTHVTSASDTHVTY